MSITPEQLEQAIKDMRDVCNRNLSHKDRDVRDMAIVLSGLIRLIMVKKGE